MPDLFVSKFGAVKVSTGVSASIAGIDVFAPNGNNLTDDNSANILITGMALTQGARVSYFTTLSESIYIYPLGNKISRCQITGLAFPDCSSTTEASSNSGYDGAKRIIDFYQANKASNFQNISSPIVITAPPISLSGFLEDMTLNINGSKDLFGVAEFTLVFSVIPEQT
jgi:hypothetical protein